MRSEKRLKEIIQILEKEKGASVRSLSERLNVSEVTIRKDLDRLELNNLVVRTHGGATIENTLISDKSAYARIKENRQLKESIGKYVAGLFKDGDALAMDSGTTPLAVARNLPMDIELCVVTNSIFCAMELSKRPNIEILFPGGKFQNRLYSVGGSFAEDFIGRLHVDVAIISAGGVVPEEGLYDNISLESYVKKKMIEIADDVFVVVDSSKFGKKLFFNFLATKDIGKLFTDSGAREEDLEILKEHGVEVFVV